MNPEQFSPERLEQIRQTAIELADRAKSDTEFREKIHQNPVGTLTEAGLPREAIGNFLRETQIMDEFDDVEGYGWCIGSIQV